MTTTARSHSTMQRSLHRRCADGGVVGADTFTKPPSRRLALPLLAAAFVLAFGPARTEAAGADAIAPRIEILSLPSAPSRNGKPVWRGTGFYVNAAGTIMTAAHVVSACAHIVVVKDGVDVAPTRMLFDSGLDVALLETDRVYGIPAVFAADPAIHSGGAYVASWMDLASSRPRDPTVANALVLAARTEGGGQSSHGLLALISSAAPGASGAPVFDEEGRVIGMVQSRVLPNRFNAAGAVQSTFAAGLDRLKPVMAAAGIAFAQSEQPQLDPTQSRRDRATSITVGIYCQA